MQLPAQTELVLRTRANFQRQGLTITNPELWANKELTMSITNASHTEQRVSSGACVASCPTLPHTPRSQCYCSPLPHFLYVIWLCQKSKNIVLIENEPLKVIKIFYIRRPFKKVYIILIFDLNTLFLSKIKVKFVLFFCVA